ncbi:MAG: diguanylate cyclase, partial [bacterium]|nr:diguanylate cyclase [bacterium]
DERRARGGGKFVEEIRDADGEPIVSVDLSVSLASLALKSPLLPGSGPPGATLRKLKALEAAGAGALVTKTISSRAAEVVKPCMAFDGELFFNTEKWSEIAPETWAREIFPALNDRNAPLIASVGYAPEDLERLIPLFDSMVDGFELSTHYGVTKSEQFSELISTAKRLTKKPVFMKLSLHAGDLAANARACEASGADGIAAINSVGPALSIDIEKRALRLSGDTPYAWLSGPAIKPLAMRAVWDISRAVTIPVIACGGVTHGVDVIEFFMAGATAVQSCTALIRGGPEWIGRTLDEVAAWCEEHDVKAVHELVGAAGRKS